MVANLLPMHLCILAGQNVNILISTNDLPVVTYCIVPTAGPILESKGMHVIFQKKGQKNV